MPLTFIAIFIYTQKESSSYSFFELYSQTQKRVDGDDDGNCVPTTVKLPAKLEKSKSNNRKYDYGLFMKADLDSKQLFWGISSVWRFGEDKNIFLDIRKTNLMSKVHKQNSQCQFSSNDSQGSHFCEHFAQTNPHWVCQSSHSNPQPIPLRRKNSIYRRRKTFIKFMCARKVQKALWLLPVCIQSSLRESMFGGIFMA